MADKEVHGSCNQAPEFQHAWSSEVQCRPDKHISSGYPGNTGRQQYVTVRSDTLYYQDSLLLLNIALVWAWWSDAMQLRWPPIIVAGVGGACTRP